MSEYRHEYKYLLSRAQDRVLEMRMRGLLAPDPHADDGGVYLIQSLYFDDAGNRCFYENENGTDPRAKFRIRYYNRDARQIRLEKKSKLRGMTKKESCLISESACQEMMRGKIPEPLSEKDPKLQSLLAQMRLLCLKPKVIVSYERQPFVCPAGNVRVTFDRNITSSWDPERFLEGDLPQRPVLKTGECIFEVKWDELLPSHVKNALQTGSLQWNSYSKYALCRKYSSNGGIII